MLLLAVQHKLFHLNESDIVEFIVALSMFKRSVIIKRQVEDLQLGVESYQKKLNITAPQKTFLEIKLKDSTLPSYKPPGVNLLRDCTETKKMLRADELSRFSIGHLRIFTISFITESQFSNWIQRQKCPGESGRLIDKKRIGLMVELSKADIERTDHKDPCNDWLVSRTSNG
ncbi:hypothetical protein Tco_0328744 [Tanacetum coccineum]